MEHRVRLIYRRFIPRQIADYGVGLLDDSAKLALKILKFKKNLTSHYFYNPSSALKMAIIK
jgi:hypothetical protein